MIKKILWVLLMMGLALFIITLQINRLGEMTPEIQMTLFMSLGIVVVLFIPPLIMSFFLNPIISYLNIAYQGVIAISFLGMLPIGFMIPNGMFTAIIALLGVGISSMSIITILRTKELSIRN